MESLGRARPSTTAARFRLAVVAAFALVGLAGRRVEAQSGEGSVALPGLVHIRLAEERPRGAAVRAGGGYGLTESIEGAGSMHHRAFGTVAISGQPLRWLGVGAQVDARADRHPQDLDPTAGGREAHGSVEVRAAHALANGLGVGALLSTTVFGRVGGGPAAAAVELGGLVTRRSGAFLLAGELGYRIDRSANAIRPGQVFGSSDRLSLGVSSFDAVLLRIAGSYTRGDSELFVEYALDALVGRGAPGFRRSPMHVDFGLRQHLSSSMALDAYVDLEVGARTAIPVAGPYVRIDPRFTLGVAFSYRFAPGATPSANAESTQAEAEADASAQTEQPAADTTANQAPTRLTARTLEGLVRDARGLPLVDARLVLTVQGAEPLETFSDATGRFRFENIPPGAAELRIEAVGLETQTLPLGAGALSLPIEGVQMTRATETGLLRATIVGFDGEHVPAVVTVLPGDLHPVVDGAGHFELALEPGTYRLRIEAPGYTAQTREVRLAHETVTILHVEMRSSR